MGITVMNYFRRYQFLLGNHFMDHPIYKLQVILSYSVFVPITFTAICGSDDFYLVQYLNVCVCVCVQVFLA